MPPRQYFVYIMASPSRSIYIGMTSNLERRVWEHKSKQNLMAHTRKYNQTLQVYGEEYSDPHSAIGREKQLKDWNRRKKLDLIETQNPG